MKKILAVLTAILLLFSFAGCKENQKQQDTLQIVCSAFPQYDFLREITKGTPVTLTLLLKAGQESHDYDPSSADMTAIYECDLFVYVGGESEHWVKKTLDALAVQDEKVYSLIGTAPLHHHEGHDHQDDEHIWTAPENAMKIVQGLTEKLCEMDTENKEIYTQNAAAYIEKLQQLDNTFQDIVASAKRQKIVVADRFPLLHFCESYGLRYEAAFTGCAASVEPDSEKVAALIQTVKNENIPAIFQTELSAGGLAQTVKEHTGCRVLTFYSCHNLSKEQFETGETYLSMMYQNADALKEALN